MASRIIPAILLLGFVLIVVFLFHPTPIKSITPNLAGTKTVTQDLKQYWMVLLKKGPKYQESMNNDSLQQAHVHNIQQLVNTGKLVVAGPFTDDGDLRGIFIMDCQDSAEVNKLVNKDPAVAAGKLTFEIKPWLTNQIIRGKQPAN